MKRIFVAVLVLILSACSFIPQRYSVSEDNNAGLKKVGRGNINVGLFTRTTEFDNRCRVVSGVIEMPDHTSFEGYIQRALVAELKAAGMFDDQTPKITLTGVVDKLAMTTKRTIYLSSWDIGVRLNSSNGETTYISEHYDFNAGPNNLPDCQIIADNYMLAVQKTLGKLIAAPEFQSLVTPKQ